MPRKQIHSCVHIWRAFGEQTYPERQIFYHRTHKHAGRDCEHRSAYAVAKPSDGVATASAGPTGIIISYIQFLGTIKRTQADEFIEIKNLGGTTQELTGWRISASGPGQNFVFPSASKLAVGASLRVYTNLESRSPDSFSFGSKRAIWNDQGDLGQLFDQNGTLIATYGYGDQETRTIDSIKTACGVSDLPVIYDPAQLAELNKQASKVDFLTALERALRCLSSDPAPGAPLHQQKLYLIQSGDLPKSGGDLRKSWFFGLQTPKGNRRWIVVDRSGAEEAYQVID